MTTTLDRPSDVDISLDIDLSLLVGPMDEQECEHPQHLTSPLFHGGKATHYGIGHHADCGYRGEVKVVCAPFVRLVQSGHTIRCAKCHGTGPAGELVTILGRVNQ